MPGDPVDEISGVCLEDLESHCRILNTSSEQSFFICFFIFQLFNIYISSRNTMKRLREKDTAASMLAFTNDHFIHDV